MEWSERSSEEQKEITARLMEKVSHLGRPAWFPVVEEGDGGAAVSKFSGAPWLAPGESWPVCPSCEGQMQLFLQLDLASLPIELRGEFGQGLLQLFYCVNESPLCEVDCEAYSPHARSTLARRVDPSKAGSAGVVDATRTMFPAQRIVGWDKVAVDLPNSEELDGQGVALDDDESDALYALELPLAGDKLAGWPNWIQGIEYPQCRTCRKPMRLVFQIDSEINLPHMFGDSGIAHLTQCPDHKDELAFGWACC